MLRLVVLSITAFTLAGCAGNKPAPADAGVATEPEPEPLSFAWPDGQKGTMTVDGMTTKDGKEVGLNVTYTVTANRGDEGLAIALTDAREISMPGVPEMSKKMALPMIQQTPTTIIKHGEVVAIRDFEGFRDELLAMMKPVFEEMPAMEAQLSSGLTPELFLASAREDWSWRGLAFHGKDLAPGEEAREQTEVGLVVVNATVPATYVTRRGETIECPGAEDRRCVKLYRELEIAPDAFSAALEPLNQLFDDVQVERSIRAELVAEPETLLPYRLTRIDETSVTLTKGENQKSQSERQERTETFTWE